MLNTYNPHMGSAMARLFERLFASMSAHPTLGTCVVLASVELLTLLWLTSTD